MGNLYIRLSHLIGYGLLFMVFFLAGASNAQIVTNGSFESSDVGIVDTTAVKGWIIENAAGINPPPVFEIVSDTVEQGSRALKVTVHGLGTNQYDIQIVADSLHVTPGATYNYSVWAKSDIPGAQVNFTVGNYSYSEYKAIRPATLTTTWTKYTMQFTVNDNQTVIRAPIHFNYAADTGNAVYIDNLQIADTNASKKPVIVEAESGILGSNFSVLQDSSVTYVTAVNNYTGQNGPGDSSRVATYQVTFPDSGFYNLFVRLRVGPNGYNDDSFFYGRGFGEKNDTASADWVFINGLASAGFTDSAAFVDTAGTVGSQVWKWVNVTKNSYQGSPGDSFYVNIDSLTKTFQIGTREDGLDIDKFAFGKSNLYFTVKDLDDDLPGSPTMSTPNTGTVWTGPAFATGQSKFIGCSYPGTDPNFTNYWDQLTPENDGKWGSVGTSEDTTQWNWNGLDAAYNYAVNNHLPFKEHCLIWGQQQPSWISSLDSAQQAAYIEYWFKKVGERYPKTDMVDVVNEPLHNPPDGQSSRAYYIKALGGGGSTGWDWVINAFTMARKYFPNAKLLINDFSIINSNSATTNYLQIIKLLKDRGLIDGIGVQGHRFELENADTATVRKNLERLGATGLPVYISEFDLGNVGNLGTPDDAQQLQLYKKIFPVLWTSPAVKGITFWGYIEKKIWQTTCYLVRSDGTARPALLWLAQYIKDNPAVTDVSNKTSDIPSAYTLYQNYPNPFNPTTNIRYSIVNTSKVTLKVYDILGREVQTLVNQMQAPGRYTVTFNGANLASGIYFYRINAGNFTATKKLMIVK